MPCAILCYECNQDLGEIYDFFHLTMSSYYRYVIEKKKISINPSNMDLKPNIIDNINFLFDALDIKNMCCKMHLIGVMNNENEYY
jgi:DNA-directed RNA polymerase subunit N (RpoN/RPB10)